MVDGVVYSLVPSGEERGETDVFAGYVVYSTMKIGMFRYIIIIIYEVPTHL